MPLPAFGNEKKTAPALPAWSQEGSDPPSYHLGLTGLDSTAQVGMELCSLGHMSRPYPSWRGTVSPPSCVQGPELSGWSLCRDHPKGVEVPLHSWCEPVSFWRPRFAPSVMGAVVSIPGNFLPPDHPVAWKSHTIDVSPLLVNQDCVTIKFESWRVQSKPVLGPRWCPRGDGASVLGYTDTSKLPGMRVRSWGTAPRERGPCGPKGENVSCLPLSKRS